MTGESQNGFLELLQLRDEIIGLRAEEAERRSRFLVLKKELRDLGKKFEEQTVLLRDNMTRAYEAEKRLLEVEAELVTVRAECDAVLSSMRTSRSWKLARALSAPSRLARRIFGS